MSDPKNRIEKYEKKRQSDLSSLIYGKVPPQNIDLEEAVLGALMLDRDAIDLVLPVLKSESFYDDRHRLIYTAITRLTERDRDIDLLTVTEELRKMGQLEEAGGPFYVTTLLNRVGSAAHVEEHARIIQQKFLSRGLINLGTTAVHDAFEDTTDVFELIAKTEQSFAELSGSVTVNEVKHIGQVGSQIQIDQKKRAEEGTIAGIPTGFSSFDDLTGGLNNSDLIIVAARPSVGKTAFACSAIINQARSGITVGVLSMEMTAQAIFLRLMNHETGIPIVRLKKNMIYENELDMYHQAWKEISALPIHIEDTANPTFSHFRANALKLKRKYGVEIIYGDHMGKIQIPELLTNTYNMVTQVARGSKALAKTLDVPLVMLNQLNRGKEQGKETKPTLSSLRDSGAIEEEADVVVLLHRNEYYHNQGLAGYSKVFVDGMERDCKGIAEVNIAKFRDGAVKQLILSFIGERTKFMDYDRNYYERDKPAVQNYIEPKDKQADLFGEEEPPF